LSEDADTTQNKQHPHYYIRDAPLSMRAALRNGHSAAGKLFEDMVRAMIKGSSSKQWTVRFFHILFIHVP
jgi:hypothetical protein